MSPRHRSRPAALLAGSLTVLAIGLSGLAGGAAAQVCGAQGSTHAPPIAAICPSPVQRFSVTASCIVCQVMSPYVTSPMQVSWGECDPLGSGTQCHPAIVLRDRWDSAAREFYSQAKSVRYAGYGSCPEVSRQKAVRACDCPSCAPVTPGGPLNNYGQNEDPLLISTMDGEYRLTSAAGGVAFDLDADGIAEQTAWTEAGSDDAFLVLDRNGNGAIDNGLEVFGDETPQLPSAEPNGFRALAVFDDPLAGGNGDGRIDAEDPIFSSLQLWIDADHDGISAPGELSPLFWRVDAIELDYGYSPLVDLHGNELRYWAMIEPVAGSTGSAVAFNVFLVQ